MKHALVLLFTLISAASVSAGPMSGTAVSAFDVKATVDSFVGNATSEPFTLDSGDDQLVITYAIAKMETGKKKRDAEMMHMFHAEEYPELSGSASAAAILALQPSEEPVELPVSFTMHGITREVPATVSNVVREDGGLAFDIAFPLVLSEFDLKAPSVMYIIRVNDTVHVSTRVTLAAVGAGEAE